MDTLGWRSRRALSSGTAKVDAALHFQAGCGGDAEIARSAKAGSRSYRHPCTLKQVQRQVGISLDTLSVMSGGIQHCLAVNEQVESSARDANAQACR